MPVAFLLHGLGLAPEYLNVFIHSVEVELVIDIVDQCAVFLLQVGLFLYRHKTDCIPAALDVLHKGYALLVVVG